MKHKLQLNNAGLVMGEYYTAAPATRWYSRWSTSIMKHGSVPVSAEIVAAFPTEVVNDTPTRCKYCNSRNNYDEPRCIQCGAPL